MNKKQGYYSLKLGGKKRTLHFSMNFWASLTEELGVGLQDLDKVFSNEMAISSVRAIIYCGMIAYDQEEGNEIDYNVYKDHSNELLVKGYTVHAFMNQSGRAIRIPSLVLNTIQDNM